MVIASQKMLVVVGVNAMARPDKQVLEERQNFVQTIADCASNPSLFSKVFLDHELFEYNRKPFEICN